MLEIHNFSKTYRNSSKRAVDNLSLTVEAGDIFGFIGHNGAGKTTTLRAAAGLLPFDEGEITVDGLSIRENPVACKKKIAYIPDNPDLYEYLTGRQYLNFVADLFGVSAKDRTARIAEYAGMLEIEGNLGELVSGYSHGMKQKLAVVSALIHEPKLLILDEPFVGLDPVATLSLKNVMHSLCEKGSAVFFSTHILEVAEKLCNKIAVIQKGKLLACGDMDSVRGDSSLEEAFMELIDHE
jgi:ABC-2 type transport system ATP-binding protein